MLSPGFRIFLLLVIALTLYSNLGNHPSSPTFAPFPVIADLPDNRFIAPLYSLALPFSMIVDSSGNLLVADGAKDQIVVLGSHAQPLHRYGQFGQAPGEFDTPQSLHLLKTGRLAVLDRENGRVQFLDLNGHIQSAISIGASGLMGLAVFPDDTFYVSCNGSVGGKPLFSVIGLRPDGKKVAHWEVPETVVDLRKEAHDRIWVLQPTGLALYSTQGKLLQRLAVPDGSSRLIQRFTPRSMYQALDGKVYVVGWDYVLVYDDHYRPLGMIPSRRLTGYPLLCVAADAQNHLWAADDHGYLVRLTLPRLGTS